MSSLLRACALALTVLVAQLGHLVPALAAAQTHAPTTPAAPVLDDALALQAAQLDGRVDRAAVRRARAERPVVPAVVSTYIPQAPSAAVVPPAHYSGTIQQIIQEAFAPLGQTAVTWAERVALCESGDNPSAVNRGSGAEGLFQIMPGTWAGTPYASQSEFDAVANAKAAAWIYARRGGSAWSCS
jgi:soluble lytic murein transglycosylase-like protein